MKDLLEIAIQELEFAHRVAGCNDFDMPDTPENRALWNECQAYLLRVPISDVEKHPDYWKPISEKGKIYVFDSILTYVLRKKTGLLKTKSIKVVKLS